MAKHKYKYQVEEDPKVKKRKFIIKEVIIWAVEAVLVVTAAYYISFFWLEKTTVIGESMSPTLEAGDSVLIDKFTYKVSQPKRFDIIVFKQSNKEHSYYDIKRIIGLPGETVTIDDSGNIYVDGNLIIEDIIIEPMLHAGLAEEGVVLDDDEYFVLGDNRNQSEDSRYANIGNVIMSDIVGKAFVKLDPFAVVSELNKKRGEE